MRLFILGDLICERLTNLIWIRFVGLSEATIIETYTQVTSPTQQIGQPRKLMQLYRIISKPVFSGIESHCTCSSIRFCIS